MADISAVLQLLSIEADDDRADLVEYMVGMMTEAEDVEEIEEGVMPMLEEIAEDADHSVLFPKLMAVVRPELCEGGSAVVDDNGPVKLDSVMVMADNTAKLEETVVESEQKVFVNSNDKMKDRTSEVRVKGTRKRSDRANKVIEQNKALEIELMAAKVAAAKAQARGSGQSISSMECVPFDLPNPGGGEVLLEQTHFILQSGRRYGLIGRNGKGKSTLLKWIAARREGCNNAAWRTASIHYVTQEVHMSEENELRRPVDIVMQADVERTLLLEEVAEFSALKTQLSEEAHSRMQAVHERLVTIGADSAEPRAQQLLVNLGFSPALLARKISELSGGWRVRVALAAALFAKPDILLLDEPTNHLSIEAVLWLEQELATSPTWQNKIIVTVSHDRSFLDSVCTDCMHISGAARVLTQSRGNFSLWAKRRLQDQLGWQKSKEARAAKRAHLTDFIAGAGTFANVMKQVNMKKKQVEKLDLDTEEENTKFAGLKEDEELPLKLESGGALDQPAVVIKNASFRYNEQMDHLFKGVEFGIRGDSRIVLLGENGMGKTTLVKLITGELEPTEGQIIRDRRARIALVNQHHADQIDLDESPLFFLLQKFPGDGSYEHEQKLRGHLTGCGINASLQGVPARGLSGGQRSRVACAAVSFARPHVLILDEPTNNLDLEAVAALADCVQKFDGAVLIVSHDQYFVGRVAKEVMVVSDQKVTQVESFTKYINDKKKGLDML